MVVLLALGAAAISGGIGVLQPGQPVTVNGRFGFCHEGGGINCVVDGDTFWAGGNKVRIAGIEAPETHEPRCPAEASRGKAATERLQALLNSGSVTLAPADGGRDQDQHGRLLRDVSVNGRDVGEALIDAGLVRAYRGGKKPWC